MPLARISLTLSRYSSRSSITPGRSSLLHPLSIQSCCRSVLGSRPTLARPCGGVHRSISLISSPLFLHQCPACPRGVMVKAMNCGIVVREFVLQSRYYVLFRANTLGKGMNPLILPPAMGK